MMGSFFFDYGAPAGNYYFAPGIGGVFLAQLKTPAEQIRSAGACFVWLSSWFSCDY
jgi:hypothetical protein